MGMQNRSWTHSVGPDVNYEAYSNPVAVAHPEMDPIVVPRESHRMWSLSVIPRFLLKHLISYGPSAWTSEMLKIMDPILPFFSILGYWAIVLDTLEVHLLGKREAACATVSTHILYPLLLPIDAADPCFSSSRAPGRVCSRP